MPPGGHMPRIGRHRFQWRSDDLHGNAPDLFRHRNRHSLSCATLRNPDRIAHRFDFGWSVESVVRWASAVESVADHPQAR